jgi:ABC-2 family transporter protein
MAWVTWRQHRLQLLVGGTLLAALAIAAAATAVPIQHAYDRHGLTDCLPPTTRSGCDLIVRHFQSQFGDVTRVVSYFVLLPALVGAFVGAPLVAREYELGTFRFAWTQSVSSRRWLLSKAAALAAASVVGAALVSALVVWWRQPFDTLGSRLRPGVFEVEGVVVPAYALFALLLGIFAGVVLRRTVAAMTVTLGLFFATRFAVAAARPHYLAPEHERVSGIDPTTHARDWILDNTLVDAVGRRISAGREESAIRHAQLAGIDPHDYLQSIGWRREVAFQPAGRFWTFQLVEGAIFVALAAVLAVATVAWLHRRRA